MTYFPMFFNLSNKKVYLCGIGENMEVQIKTLMKFNPHIYVFPEKKLQGRDFPEDVVIMDHPVTEEDFKELPVCTFISCEENRNTFIVSLCKKYNIPVYVANHPELCDFTFGSMIATDHLCVSVNTEESPTAAEHLKKDFQKILPDQIDSILESMTEVQNWAHSWCSSPTELKEVLQIVVSQAFIKGRQLTNEELQKIRNVYIE